MINEPVEYRTRLLQAAGGVVRAPRPWARDPEWWRGGPGLGLFVAGRGGLACRRALAAATPCASSRSTGWSVKKLHVKDRS
jgi:hypothetical protein